MSRRAWPSREEWQADAERYVRTFRTRWERLDPNTVWSTLAEDIELEELARNVTKALRPVLTSEINRLRAEFPGRPKAGRARSLWTLELPEDQYAMACDLAGLEGIRTEINRAIRDEHWGTVGWHVGRIRKSYPALRLSTEVLEALDRMNAIGDAIAARRDKAAVEAEEAAIAREVARRATDEAWQEELERRAALNNPRVIRVGQPSPTEGDRMT